MDFAMTHHNYTDAVCLVRTNTRVVASDLCRAQASGHSCWDAHLEETTL